MRRFISLFIAILMFILMQWSVRQINVHLAQTSQFFIFGYLGILVKIFGYQLIAILLLKDTLLVSSRKLSRTFIGLLGLFLVNALVMWLLLNHGVWLGKPYVPFAYVDGIVWMFGLMLAEYILK